MKLCLRSLAHRCLKRRQWHNAEESLVFLFFATLQSESKDRNYECTMPCGYRSQYYSSPAIFLFYQPYQAEVLLPVLQADRDEVMPHLTKKASWRYYLVRGIGMTAKTILTDELSPVCHGNCEYIW